MKRKRYHRGFTVLEILVVTSIIGMMASLSMPLWTKSITAARMNMCIYNQRKIYEAVAQYELERGKTLNTIASNGASIRNVLYTNNYFDKMIYFECPASTIKDYDDYILSYSGTTLQGVICSIYPTLHVSQ